jgi:hypothetical protein
MGGFLEQLMKLSIDVMVSSMETITKTMQEIQKKPDTPDETENSDGTDEGQTSSFNNVSRLTVESFLGIFKLPMDVLASSVKTIVETTQEMQEQASADDSGEVDDDYDLEIVSLTAQEAALESKAILTAEVEEMSEKTLWQIGRSGRIEVQGKWTAAFDYHVGTDIDAINNPGIPHLITVQGGPKSKGATEKLNIHFALDRDYPDGQLAFIYDRWGAEKDQVLIDGELLAPISGPGTGKFKHVALSLKHVSNGDHVITITTSGETETGGHRIDYLKLLCCRASDLPDSGDEAAGSQGP